MWVTLNASGKDRLIAWKQSTEEYKESYENVGVDWPTVFVFREA